MIVLIFPLYVFISPYTLSHVELWVLSLILTFCFSYTQLHFSFILVMFFLLVYRVSTHRHYLFYFRSLNYSFDSLEHIPKSHPCPLYFFHPFSQMVVYLCNTPIDSLFFFIDLHLLIHSTIDIVERLWGPWSLSFFICYIVYTRGIGIDYYQKVLFCRPNNNGFKHLWVVIIFI